jgi:hypothetical protein
MGDENAPLKLPPSSTSSRSRLVSGGFFPARLGGRASGFGSKPLPFQIGLVPLSLRPDSVLLTHEAVAIGRKRHRRNLESRRANQKWDAREFAIAIFTSSRLKTLPLTLDLTALPQRFPVMPKSLIGTSLFLLTLSLLFGFLNTSKVKGLRSQLADSISREQMAMNARSANEKKIKAREKEFSDGASKIAAAEAKASNAEAELHKAQNERAELAAKLQAGEGQIADLQKRVADATVGAANGVGEASPDEIKTQLDDAKRELEAAEQEKAVLADKVKAAQDRVAAMEEEKRRREAGANAPGVHGTVLAVNQAYNFVVLSLGERQGVVPNSEMLVMRSGALIGKIRISSVEPTTSIGDIISNSLARGVQVQPGDTVIYAGSTNS